MLKNKKFIKVLSIIMLVVMMLVVIGSSASAAVTVPEPDDSVNLTNSVSSTVKTVLGIIKYGGIVVAVCVAMFIGVKYITASPEGKAEVKKTIMFYVGGIVILLSASAIVTAIQSTLGSTSGGDTSTALTQIIIQATLGKGI